MLRRSLAVASLAFLVSACAVPPARPYPPGSPSARGSRDPSVYSDDDVALERARLRRRAEARMRAQKERLERVGRRLLETMPDRPEVQFVIDSGNPDVNAGATFGQVAVTAGMLDFVKSDDELAFVLGHELAHITEGHVTKGVVGGLALNVLAIVVESAAPGAGQLAGGIGQLFLNHYTQTQEREADSVGLRTAYGAGYDPRAAVEINQRMAVEAPQTMTAGYFDTHPSSPERAVAARKLSEQLLAQGPPPGREQVLAMEERGEDRFSARDASYEDEPAVRDDAAADYAVSSYRHEEAGPRRDEPADGAASSEECRRAETYTGMARDARDLADRESYLRRALRVCPGLVSAHVDLGRVLRERGDAAGAEREFRRALEIDPGDREARRELGR